MKKCHFHGRCIALTTNECHSFAVKHAWDYKRDRRADCSWARLVTCFCVVFTQPKPRDHLLSSE